MGALSMRSGILRQRSIRLRLAHVVLGNQSDSWQASRPDVRAGGPCSRRAYRAFGARYRVSPFPMRPLQILPPMKHKTVPWFIVTSVFVRARFAPPAYGSDTILNPSLCEVPASAFDPDFCRIASDQSMRSASLDWTPCNNPLRYSGRESAEARTDIRAPIRVSTSD